MAIPSPQQVHRPSRPLQFLKGFLRNPKEVGSVIPSSRFLTRRVLQCGEVREARVIVELGPGTGVLTGQMLAQMRADAKLVAIEISAEFVRLLRREYPDPRLVLFEGSSADLEKALCEADATQADLVVSGIPFSTLEYPTRYATLEAIRKCLRPGGRFVAYQFRGHVRRFAEPVFGPGLMQHELLNIPPMRVYSWDKRG